MTAQEAYGWAWPDKGWLDRAQAARRVLPQVRTPSSKEVAGDRVAALPAPAGRVFVHRRGAVQRGRRMHFEATKFGDAWVIVPERMRDARGYFMRTFCAATMGARGLETTFPQHSTSFSAKRGTVRGMHIQTAPHQEVKIVRCLKGALLDVIVDLRPGSPTFKQWQGFELSAANEHQLYVPKGFAHGFQTLTDDVLTGYLISTPYAASAASGVRHDDPAFGITWPLPISAINDKDLKWPDFGTV